MAKMGRPKKDLDEDYMRTLRGYNWTLRQIGDLFGVAHTTIARRLRKPKKSAPKQEVIIIRASTYTQYIVVNRKVHTVFAPKI